MTIQDILKNGNVIRNVDRVDKITEVALIEFIANDAVEEIAIIQTREGTFILVVKLTWKKELSVLETSRNTVREWVKYERLAKHIEDKYPKIPALKVILNYRYTVDGHNLLPNIKTICFDTEVTEKK